MRMPLFLAILFFTKTSLCRPLTQDEGDDTTKAASAFIGMVGDTADVSPPGVRPGFLLAGGSTDVDAAMKWLLDRAAGGDVVILRASGSTGYNPYLYGLAKVNSVETLLINSFELAQDPAVALRIRQAECLFIAGGDQWNYIHYWMNTPVAAAINYLVNEKKVPVGGTSAGLAVLGQFAFDARNDVITSEEALANPYNEKLSITKDFLHIGVLKNLVTDSHYSQRNRQGRHIAFMARIIQDGNKNIRGIGVDEKTAVAVDEKGDAVVFGKGEAYFYISGKGKPEKCETGVPLEWYNNGKALQVYLIQGSENGSGHFNIPKWKHPSGGVYKHAFVKGGKVFIE